MQLFVQYTFNFKIRDDGKLPQTICPGCNIQLEATAQFFDLLVVGQRKLRELWKYQVEQHRKAERLRSKKESTEHETEGVDMDSITSCNEDEQYEQQIIIKSNMIFFFKYIVYYKKGYILYNLNNIMYEIVILVLPDGSMYAAEHEMSLQMEGLTKPRRKRGRPPKVQAEAESLVCNKL